MALMSRITRGFGFEGLRSVGKEFSGAFRTLGKELTTGDWSGFRGYPGIIPPAMPGVREQFRGAGRGFTSWALAKEYTGARKLGAIGMRGALMYGAYGATTGMMYGGTNRGAVAGGAVGAGAAYAMGGPIGMYAGAGMVAGKMLTGGLGPSVYGAMAPLRTTTDLFTSAVGSVTSGISAGMGLISNSAINPVGRY